MSHEEGRFRIFPSSPARQRFSTDHAVCGECLGGTCCSSEDPIYLTAFDLLRLSTFFDLSPAAFMLRFTQDRFEGEDSDVTRRPWIDDASTSVVTYLRRRANYPTSPCVFLKYIHGDDGVPRRVCSVHPARPLSCREYYYDTCKTRWTGELAAIQSRALLLVHSGRVPLVEADSALRSLIGLDPATASISRQLELAFWTEVRRALDIDAANSEPANTFDLAGYQDPIDAKLNRLLSTTNLRLEEKYGPIPSGEQLHAYAAGRAFPSTDDYRRIMRITSRRGKARLFAQGDYPHYVANRFLVPGAAVSRRFPAISPRRLDRILKHCADPRQQAITRAAFRAADALVRFAALAAGIGKLLEFVPAGAIERELLFALSRIESSGHPCWSLHPGLARAKDWAASRVELPAAWRKRIRRPPPASRTRIDRWLASQLPDGTWCSDISPSQSTTQADYWRSVLHSTAAALLDLRPCL